MLSLSVVVLAFVSLFYLTSLAESQETLVFNGTGVNGRVDITGNNDVIVLGGLFPVHKNVDNRCGGILDLGVQRLEAMVLATEKINNDQNFLPGVDLAFEIRDTCVRANEALEQSLKYVTERSLVFTENRTILGISGVVGAASSSVSVDTANLLRLFDIPQISYASTAKTLSDTSRFEYFFRTVPPDSLQALAMADIIEYFNWTYVIAMHSSDTYGTEGIRSLIDELESRNTTQKCVAVMIEVDQNDESYNNAVEAMDTIWVRNATVVVLFAQLATATGVLQAVRHKQATDPEFAAKNFTWIGSDAWGDQIPAELYDIARGSLSVIPESLLSSEFDDYFQALHPLNYTANPWFREYWESVFNCSLESSNTEVPQCDLANQVISSQSGYRQNSKVTFTIDAVYAFAHAIHNLQRDLCQGDPGLCSDIIDTRSGGVAIQGDLLLQYLYNVSFPGTSTELIDFDSNGDQRGGYIVKNLQKKSESEFVFENIGRWEEAPTDRSISLSIFREEIQWSHGLDSDIVPQSLCSHPCPNGEHPIPIANQAECCWVCSECPGDSSVSTGVVCTQCERGYTPNEEKTECVLIEPSYLTWSHGWSIVIIILTIIGIIVTTVVAIIFIVYNQHKLIKASSRELSAVLLIGIMLCYLLPFFFIAKPSPWICVFRRFGVGFCFAVCYSALLVKTNRIHRIFNRSPGATANPPLISPLSQLFFTALLVAVQIIIATVWLVVEIPSITYVYSKTSTELKCGESPHIGLSITLGYNALLLIVTLYFAFRTRKVPQNFNEAKFINFTVYTLCILWLAFIPTYYSTATLGTIYQTGSQVLVIILNASVTLGILFLPKIYFLFSQIRKGTTGTSEVNNTFQHSSSAEKPRLGSIDRQASNLSSFRLISPSNTLKISKSEDSKDSQYRLSSSLGTVLEEKQTVSSEEGSPPETDTNKQFQYVDASTQTLE